MKELERIQRLVELHKKKRKKWLLLTFAPTGAALVVVLIVLLSRTIFSGSKAAPEDEREPETIVAQASTEQPESETSRRSQPVRITVSMVGDCTLGKDEAFNYGTSLNAYYDMYGASYFFRNVKSILEADDLTVANCEGTLTSSGERNLEKFAFKAPAEYAKIFS